MSGSTTAPPTTVTSEPGFLGLDWTDKWTIIGAAGVAIIGLLVLMLLVFLIVFLVKKCCRKSGIGGEATVAESEKAAHDLQHNNYLQELMASNPKATSISQYGRPQK